jgi:hypothetical protein
VAVENDKRIVSGKFLQKKLCASEILHYKRGRKGTKFAK